MKRKIIYGLGAILLATATQGSVPGLDSRSQQLVGRGGSLLPSQVRICRSAELPEKPLRWGLIEMRRPAPCPHSIA